MNSATPMLSSSHIGAKFIASPDSQPSPGDDPPCTLRPLRATNVLTQGLGGELLLYTAHQKKTHVLNPTARRIWELCDGNHSVETIAQKIRETCLVTGGHDVERDVRKTLENFASKDLLQSQSAQNPSIP